MEEYRNNPHGSLVAETSKASIELNDNNPSNNGSSGSENSEVKNLVLLPLYWSDCEPPNCLNFPESVKLPPTNVEASDKVLLVRQLHLKWEGNFKHNRGHNQLFN